MENFAKCQFQPLSKRGIYKICTQCYDIVYTHRYIQSENMCQKCSIQRSKYYILYILKKASGSPGINYIYKNIMFKYL